MKVRSRRRRDTKKHILKFPFLVYIKILEYNPNIVLVSTDKFDFLTHLFNQNKIETKFEILNEERDKIYIGLRRDLREFPEFCAKLLQTIIFYLEGNLKIRKNNKIPKIPKLQKIVKEHGEHVPVSHIETTKNFYENGEDRY